MRFADCHPDRKHYGRGLCCACYQRALKSGSLPTSKENLWSFNCVEADLYWLAGILEGEGCFYLRTTNERYKRAAIRLSMTDKDIVQRVRDIVGYGNVNTAVLKSGKTTYVWSIQGSHAVQVMRKIKFIMGKRRLAKIKEVLEEHLAQHLVARTDRGWDTETFLRDWERQKSL